MATAIAEILNLVSIPTSIVGQPWCREAVRALLHSEKPDLADTARATITLPTSRRSEPATLPEFAPHLSGGACPPEVFPMA